MASRSSGRRHCGPSAPCLAPYCAEEPTASRLARISRALSRLTSTTNSPAAVLSNRTSSGAATMASLRSAWLNRFCVVTTMARFSIARDQIKLRQLAHSFPLLVPAGMKINSAQRKASARMPSPTLPRCVSNTGNPSPGTYWNSHHLPPV